VEVVEGADAESVRLAPGSVGLDVSTNWNHDRNSCSRLGGGGGVLPSRHAVCRSPLFSQIPSLRLSIMFFSQLDSPYCGKCLCFSLLSRKCQKKQWLAISGQWSVDRRPSTKNTNAAGMSRRARAWISAYGNSMRREGEIICKTAGNYFSGGELDRVGCAVGVFLGWCRNWGNFRLGGNRTGTFWGFHRSI
jgi:hypothetical protein